MIHVIAQSTGHSVRRICQSLQVPRSSYYHAAAPTESQRSDAQMSQAIGTIFHHHRRRYGYSVMESSARFMCHWSLSREWTSKARAPESIDERNTGTVRAPTGAIRVCPFVRKRLHF